MIKSLFFLIYSIVVSTYFHTVVFCGDKIVNIDNNTVRVSPVTEVFHVGHPNEIGVNSCTVYNPTFIIPGKTNIIELKIVFKGDHFTTDEKFLFKVKIPKDWDVKEIVMYNQQQNNKKFVLTKHQGLSQMYNSVKYEGDLLSQNGKDHDKEVSGRSYYEWWVGRSESIMLFTVNERRGTAKIKLEIYLEVPVTAKDGKNFKIDYSYSPFGNDLDTEANYVETNVNVSKKYY